MRKLGYDSKQIAAATGLRPAPSFLVYPNGGSSRRKNSRSVMPNHLQPAWDHARKTTLNAQEPSFSRGHTYGLYVYFLVFKAWSKEESAPHCGSLGGIEFLQLAFDYLQCDIRIIRCHIEKKSFNPEAKKTLIYPGRE